MKRFTAGFGAARHGSLSPNRRPTPHAGNMSRVVSIETPESRDYAPHGKASPNLGDAGFDSQGYSPGHEIATIASPSRAGIFDSGRVYPGADVGLITGVVTPSGYKSPVPRAGGLSSPTRSFLSREKLPEAREVGDASSRHSASSEPQSSRASSASASSEVDSACAAASRTLQGRCYEGENLVLVAFDANARDAVHGAVTWALQNALKTGDALTLVGVLDYVRGPLGYKCQVDDQTWLGANQRFLEEEIRLKKQAWSAIPGLDRRCKDAGVKLTVEVKAANHPEVLIVKEATNLDASHVVLDKSLRNRRRRYYLEHLACDVTRMRRSGGIDAIRSSAGREYPRLLTGDRKFAAPPSPTSVIQLPLSYRHQTDVFKITLRPKRVPSSESSAASMSASSAGQAMSPRQAAPSSFTSSSDAAQETDDELFSIYHGSTRLADAGLSRLEELGAGYESDDLFSIGNASTRRESVALSGPTEAHSMRYSTVSNDAVTETRRISVDADHGRLDKRLMHHLHNAAVSSSSSPRVADDTDSGRAASAEPVAEATIARMTFVVGLGDAVEVTLCSALRPGEGLLVGASPTALFLVHVEMHHQTGMFPFRVSAGPPGAFVAVEGRMVMKLADLASDQCVLVADAHGRSRTVAVAHTTTTPKPLVLVEAEAAGDRPLPRHSVMLHHTAAVCLVAQGGDAGVGISVDDLKVGDRVMLRLRSSRS